MIDWFPLGDRAITFRLADRLEPALLPRIQSLGRKLEQLAPQGLLEWLPGMTGLTVYYDPLVTSYDKMVQAIGALAEASEEQPAAGEEPKLVEIPVCYGGEYGPDLAGVAEHCGMSVDEVIALHSGAEYLVHMLGFMPGFPYLGGLPERLACPRHATPRAAVGAGSVGIAGSQTGIYPVATPGGWQIIGRTPRSLFQADRDRPSLFEPGDRLRFRPIPANQFDALRD